MLKTPYIVLACASLLLFMVSLSIIHRERTEERTTLGEAKERRTVGGWFSTTSTTTAMASTSTSTSSSTTTTSSTATTTTKSPPTWCPPNGVWSEWVTTGHCPTTCGGCNVATRKRTCTKTCGDCPCSGLSEDVGPCGLDLCPFPSPVGTCCKPLNKMLNYHTHKFFCGEDNVKVQCRASRLRYPVIQSARPLLHANTTNEDVVMYSGIVAESDANPKLAVAESYEIMD